MVQLLSYVKQFIQDDFHPGYYSSVFFFLTTAIFLNYYFDFENSILRAHFGEISQILYYLVFFAVPYFFSLLAYAHFKNDYSVFKSKKCLGIIFLILLVMSFNASLYLLFHLGKGIPVSKEQARFFYKCVVNIVYLLNFLIPLYIFRKTINRELEDFYGFTFHNVNFKIYSPLLIIPVLLAALASFSNDFLNTYPTYPLNTASASNELPLLVTVPVYEILYGIQFVFIELFFRGLLVIGMIKYFGKSAVVSMVSVYVFWHFGKPMGEAISAIFGGYLLGVFAYYTRNIWGGILLHVGIAWSMDAAAAFQKGVLKF